MKYWIALVLGFGLAVVILLLAFFTLSNVAFFYLALPGLVAHDSVGGGTLGILLAIAINGLAYSVVLWALAKLFRRPQHPSSQPTAQERLRR